MAQVSPLDVGNLEVKRHLRPLIINSSLEKSGFLNYLGSGFKLRVSKRTPYDSVILTSCGTAVLMVDVSKLQLESDSSSGHCISDENMNTKLCPKQSFHSNANKLVKKSKGPINQNKPLDSLESIEQLLERVKSFMKGHGCCIILLVGPVFGPEDVGGRVITILQENLLPSPPSILLAHGDGQAAMHLEIISKGDQRTIIRERVQRTIASAFNKEHNIVMGKAIGLNYHKASALIDSFGSLASVAAASSSEIHQHTPLDASCADKVFSFLGQDTVYY